MKDCNHPVLKSVVDTVGVGDDKSDGSIVRLFRGFERFRCNFLRKEEREVVILTLLNVFQIA